MRILFLHVLFHGKTYRPVTTSFTDEFSKRWKDEGDEGDTDPGLDRRSERLLAPDIAADELL